MKPEIFTVATAHLDTTWHWELETTIRECLPATCEDNFRLLEKYPEYVFNFEGAYRYELIEEYYPEYFEKMRGYIKAGRWYPSGSAYENGDTNIPSPEALFRNILYGSDYFEKKFGTYQHELFLPDCFGFSYVLPSVARHAGLCGFSTQKLPRVCSYPIPFDFGRWYGVDGSYIYASLDCMSYSFSFKKSVRGYHHIKSKLRENINRFGLPFAEIYHGVGDKGGAPEEKSVEIVCREIRENSVAASDVISARADEIFLAAEALPEDVKASLPEWRDELIATYHGAGCYTARTCSKRWNRLAQQLMSVAEGVCLAACLAGEYEYPQQTMDRCIKTVLAHQFHDDITGTGAMTCSQRSWNDYAMVHACLENEIYASAGALSGILDTSFCVGTPLIAGSFAGVSGRRRQSITAELSREGRTVFSVYDAQGNELPCGCEIEDNGKCLLTFEADIPACGMAVFDVRSQNPDAFEAVKASESLLENDYLKVSIDKNGDICSIFDKENKREVLSAPIKFLITDFSGSVSYPAWEFSYDELNRQPDSYPSNPQIHILEASPARACIEIKRSFKGSVFIQRVSLDRTGRRVNTDCEIDWRTYRSLMRVSFPFAAGNEYASYDLGLGVIRRKNGNKMRYEFPAQNWADISAEDGAFGVSVLSDSRTGWEKPTDNTLNLTAVFSPKVSRGENCSQQLLDFGINRFSYSVLPHQGSAQAYTQREGEFFNSPVFAFETSKHTGKAREMSFISLNNENIAVRAFKKALNSDDVVVRFNELCGQPQQGVEFSVSAMLPGFKLISASQADARENVTGDAVIKDGKLIFDIGAYSVKTFLLKCERGEHERTDLPVMLPFNTCASSANGENTAGPFEDGLSIPSELISERVSSGGTVFRLKADGENAVRCAGQKIIIHAGTSRVCLLAASVNGDSEAEFAFAGSRVKKNVPDMLEPFAQWDMLAAGQTGYVKKGVPALVFTHTHSTNGDEAGRQCKFFNIQLEVPSDADSLTLPEDPDIFILAATFERRPCDAVPALSLCESLEKRECDFIYPEEEKEKSVPSPRESRRCKMKSDLNYVKLRFHRELSGFKKKR